MSEKHPVNKSTPPICFTQKYSLPLLALPPFLRESRGRGRNGYNTLTIFPPLLFFRVKHFLFYIPRYP